MRRAESLKRSKYTCFDTYKGKSKLLPILNWSDLDIWQYIAERKLNTCDLYREGFTRIGCVLCPFHGKAESLLEIQKFPRIANLWKLAAVRYIEKRKLAGWIPQEGGYTNGEEYFNWWIKR
jgi:phosphoadenosine phosphosulfate reductase